MAKKQLVRLNKNGPNGEGLEQLGLATLGEIVAGSPKESAHNFFTDETGQFMTGVWECQAGTMKLTDYPFDEFCHIISGKVIITDEDGHTEAFGPGDVFTIEKGFKGTWHMPEIVRKYYTIYQAK